MELAALVQDIHRLNHQLERFERKYGVMSETFYESCTAGEEPADDAWVPDLGNGPGYMRSGEIASSASAVRGVATSVQ